MNERSSTGFGALEFFVLLAILAAALVFAYIYLSATPYSEETKAHWREPFSYLSNSEEFPSIQWYTATDRVLIIAINRPLPDIGPILAGAAQEGATRYGHAFTAYAIRDPGRGKLEWDRGEDPDGTICKARWENGSPVFNTCPPSP